MRRKKRGKFLAAILAAVMLIPQSAMTVGATDSPAPVFTHEATASVSSGSGAVTVGEEVVSTMAASEDVTVNLTFATANTGLQVLFYMGDNTVANNYASVYLDGRTLGIEHRSNDASGSQQISDRTCTIDDSVNLTEPHTFTFVMEGGSHYSLYLDGKQIKTSDVTVNFNTNLTTANYLGFGNGSRSSGNTYPFTGTLSNIELYDAALTEDQIMSYHNGGLEDVVYSYDGAYYPSTTPAENEYVTEKNLTAITALEQGSITVRYRVTEVVNDPQMLLALSNSTAEREYLGLYVNPSTSVFGFDAQGGSSGVFGGRTIDLSSDRYSDLGVSINDTNWHTITVTKDESVIRFYVDGVYVDRYSNRGAGFLNLVSSPDTLAIGKAARISPADNMELSGAIDNVTIYSSVLSDTEIARADSVTQWTPEEEVDMTDAYISEAEDLFYSGYNGSNEYRIPSLLTTQEGTQLAFIDERNSWAADNGNIDAVVRRKEAGEDTFSAPITLVDLPNNGNSAAFAIDMVTVEDQTTGKIFAFVDMFPESSGLMNTGLLTAGVGYEEVGGEMCQILYDNSTSTNKTKFGHIRNIENGVGHVLGVNGEDTGYTVIVYPSQAGVSLQEKGNLYKDGEYKGNIYMYNNGPDKGELCVLNTSYLWMVTSDDDGLTWSDPVDITPQVKEDWALFFGTGPGVGIQLHTGDYEGRLVVPIYTANANVGSSQSSAVIYSDDHGETWQLGESPQKRRGYDRETMSEGGMLTESQAVQLNNGNVLLFMRNNFSNNVQMATSTDGGATWDSVEAIDPPEVYCQLSVIHYTKQDGTEWVLLSNPTTYRYNGKLRLGQVQENGTIDWQYEREINGASEKFQYSCLTLTDNTTDNPKFAMMYEDDTSGSFRIIYFEFDENYIKAGNVTPTEMDAPQFVSSDVQMSDGTATISLTFDQVIMAAGNPQLSLELGDETATADYASGSGTDTIVFEAEIAQSSGILKATGLNLEAGLLENIQNKSPELSDVSLYTNTEIDLSNTEVTYTTQHSSSTAEGTDGAAVNVIDGNPNTYWHSTWGQQSQGIELPQSVTLNIREVKTIYKVDYLARQNGSSGRILEYGIEVSVDGTEFTEVAHGTLASTTEWQEIEFIPVEAQYVRFVGYRAASSGTESCAIAELKLHEYSEGVIEQGDETQLNSLVSASAALEAGDYSSVTWEAYEAALAEAQTILDAEEPVSQNIIDRSAENLREAQNALVNISRAKEQIQAIRDTEEQYTPASWAVLSQWLTENEPQLDEADSAKEVTDMLVAFAFQTGQLVEKADKTALQNLLTEYTVTNPLTEEGYEEDSWTTYQTAISEAQTVLADDNASAQDVTDAIAELTEARAALKADMSELQTLYDTYSAYKEADYLPNDDWDSMQSALKEADEMLEAGTATPSEVKDMISKLNEAAQALDLRPSTAGLKTAYDALKEELPDLGIYMSEGAQEMEAAFKDAEAVLADPQTAEQVQAQIDALNKAYEGLILKATDEQILALTGMEESLSHKDVSGLNEAQRQQVEEVRKALWDAITADEISSVYADGLLKEAEAAMALTAETQEATEEQMQALEDIEALLSQKDMSGLSETQRQQVESVLERLQTALASGSISSEYAHMLLKEAEAAMALSGDPVQPQDPTEEKPSGNKPDGTDSKTDTADKDKAVKTGDTAEFGWMILMLAVSMTAAAVVLRRRSGKN